MIRRRAEFWMLWVLPLPVMRLLLPAAATPAPPSTLILPALPDTLSSLPPPACEAQCTGRFGAPRRLLHA
jgi:hypothetical protein